MSFGRCLGLLIERGVAVDDEGLGQIAQVGLFFSFFPLCLRLIDVVAFLGSFRSSRRGWRTLPRFYKSAKETWRLLWGLRRLVVVLVGRMEMRWLRGRSFGVIFGVQ